MHNQLLSHLTSSSIPPLTLLSGYAGTGKTTTLSNLLPLLPYPYALCAPTGKACRVLHSKGLTSAQTIHSLIYEIVSHRPLEFRKRRTLPPHLRLIIIDEASMISTDMLADLLSYSIPLLLVGDSYQLPPISNDPKLFTCGYPTFNLTTIHRQLSDSPILSIATTLRTSPLPLTRVCRDHSSVTSFSSLARTKIDHSTSQFICGYNKTRHRINDIFRIPSTSALPSVGDKLICLKNNHELGLTNGELLTVTSTTDDNVISLINDQGMEYNDIKFDLDTFFTREVPRRSPRDVAILDYGYCITCHKSQGSEFEHVYCFNEPMGDDNRWAYTAVTRASKTFTLLV